jgi:hypothetical protein
MTPSRQLGHFSSRAFMVKHQYTAMLLSLVVGFIWIGVYRLLAQSWFLSRLSILLAVISFVPAGLVFLAHFRELGPFWWRDNSNVVLTTRRSPRLERAEITLMAVLWAIIFVFVVIAIFSAQ